MPAQGPSVKCRRPCLRLPEIILRSTILHVTLAATRVISTEMSGDNARGDTTPAPAASRPGGGCWTSCLRTWINCLGTEPSGSGRYATFTPSDGHFACRACRAAVYSSSAKMSAGCGWPAFDKCYIDAIATKRDLRYGYDRTEILCGRCGTHFGHIFTGEGLSDTDQRHCVNSRALVHIPPRQIDATQTNTTPPPLPQEVTLNITR